MLLALLFAWLAWRGRSSDIAELRPYPDATEYAVQANAFARGEQPWVYVGGEAHPSRFSPVFGAVLAGGILLTDLFHASWLSLRYEKYRLLADHRFAPTLAVTMMLAVLAIWAVFRRAGGSREVGALLLVCLATSPAMEAGGGRLMSEGLMLVLGGATLYGAAMAQRVAQKHQGWAWACSSASAGLLAWMRPTHGVLLMLVAAAAIMQARSYAARSTTSFFKLPTNATSTVVRWSSVVGLVAGLVVIGGLIAGVIIWGEGSIELLGYRHWKYAPDPPFALQYAWAAPDFTGRSATAMGWEVLRSWLGRAGGATPLGVAGNLAVTAMAGAGFWAAIAQPSKLAVHSRLIIVIAAGYGASQLLIHSVYAFFSPRFLLPSLGMQFLMAGFGVQVLLNRTSEGRLKHFRLPARLAILSIAALLVLMRMAAAMRGTDGAAAARVGREAAGERCAIWARYGQMLREGGWGYEAAPTTSVPIIGNLTPNLQGPLVLFVSGAGVVTARELMMLPGKGHIGFRQQGSTDENTSTTLEQTLSVPVQLFAAGESPSLYEDGHLPQRRWFGAANAPIKRLEPPVDAAAIHLQAVAAAITSASSATSEAAQLARSAALFGLISVKSSLLDGATTTPIIRMPGRDLGGVVLRGWATSSELRFSVAR